MGPGDTGRGPRPRHIGFAPLSLAVLLAATLHTQTTAAPEVEVLRSVGGLPPHVVGLFEEPLAFQQTAGGPYYVFDRRGHSVYTVDAGRTAVRKLIEVGPEQGRIIQPRGFDTDATGSFVVADVPGGIARVQVFGAAGLAVGGFTLPAQGPPAMTVGTRVLIS